MILLINGCLACWPGRLRFLCVCLFLRAEIHKKFEVFLSFEIFIEVLALVMF